MAVFDVLSKGVFSATQCVFGDTLIWSPGNVHPALKINVLYNNPESKAQLGDTEKFDYSEFKHFFEYYEDQLKGLKFSVDNGKIETVLIKGENLVVKKVEPKYDGKTLVAYCMPYEL